MNINYSKSHNECPREPHAARGPRNEYHCPRTSSRKRPNVYLQRPKVNAIITLVEPINYQDGQKPSTQVTISSG